MHTRSLFKEFIFKTTLNRFIKKNIKFNKNSDNVLFWEFGGFPLIFKKNIIFSLALNLRGFKTFSIICDGVSSACIQKEFKDNDMPDKWHNDCKNCLSGMIDLAKKYKIKYFFASNFLSNKEKIKLELISNNVDVADIKDFVFLGIKVGYLAWSSFNRYMKGYLVGSKNFTFEKERIYRKYFYSSLVNTYIANKIIDKYKPISIFTSHGVYVDYAPSLFISYKKNIFSMSWASGYSNFLHYFTLPKKRDALSLRGIGDKYWNLRKRTILNFIENTRLDKFFENRYFKKKSRDIMVFSKPTNLLLLRKKIGILNDNPIVIFFTQVNWDVCFDFLEMIFANPNEWVVESINKMSQIKEVNWVIRIHPGELIDGSCFTTDDLIKKSFNNLPENIKILWSTSKINSYDLFSLADIGITITGTIGVELPCFGKPVITAARSHYSHKGFTVDPKNKEEYFNYLENIRDIKPLTKKQLDLARKYAYSYFIQRQIPLNVINKSQGHWGDIDLKKLDLLLPGKDPVMDKICDGIVNGKEIILDEKEISWLEKANLM